MKEKAGQLGSCPPNFGYLLNACLVPIPMPDAGTVMESQSLASLWGDLLKAAIARREVLGRIHYKG